MNQHLRISSVQIRFQGFPHTAIAFERNPFDKCDSNIHVCIHTARASVALSYLRVLSLTSLVMPCHPLNQMLNDLNPISTNSI